MIAHPKFEQSLKANEVTMTIGMYVAIVITSVSNIYSNIQYIIVNLNTFEIE